MTRNKIAAGVAAAALAVGASACTTVVVHKVPGPTKTVPVPGPTKIVPVPGPTQTVPASPSPAPPPQLQDVSVCMPAGTCTPMTQQNFAGVMGITDPAGMNGCLVVGNCDSSQQQGIANQYGL